MTESVTSSGGTQICEEVVESVAACHGIDPIDIETPLYEAIEPDSLGVICAGPRTGESAVTVKFVYYGCCVVATSDGDVEAHLR